MMTIYVQPKHVAGWHKDEVVLRLWFCIFSVLLIQGDRRESDGFQKKKYSVDFQLEMDVFLQN